MTVELRPFGVNCNIACQYCYQNPQRDAGNVATSYDMEAMKAALSEEGQPFAIFGGEPLLLPEDDLEELLTWGHAEYGRNTIQTNGILINDDHVRMFKAYGVQVGISLDGPGSLNDVRWAGTLAKTRESTAKAERAIEKLCAANIAVSVIVTLHRNNATADKLPIMHDFLRKLASDGVQHVRLHVLEVESPAIRAKYALSTEENAAALLSFAKLAEELPPEFLDVFHDIEHLIQGKDSRTACVWRACDPYTTAAVRGVEGHGQRSNCGRTNKEGIDFVKTDRAGYERYIALYQTPQQYDGCQGCRFFLMCKGQCPGTAIDGDWRNRTEHCDLWKELFTYFEEASMRKGDVPLSMCSQRLQIEQTLLAAWIQGRNPTVESVMKQLDIELGAIAQEGSA
ncbi:radical SAM protein [Chloroflexi bacterium TSY]|nr:radical SAM protein [Chloroflexi bacterium TSY]